ncbi:DUF445 domain-containing protein [Paenibacillus chungangensis]|uniref:DUF445 domain-containing protein n=1 Tax=Paenibacillus chungangensis TaxID=696535 RepID=A0ABW3HUD3_9BACL
MRRKANLSLAVLAAAFTAAAICLYYYPGQWWSRLLLYTAEAGLVGALADLFAVTALFRHPLGWKWVPHTAIVPKNRDKLVDGVVHMVEEQLLSKGMLREKLSRIRIVETAISLIDRTAGKRAVAELGWKLIVTWLKGADTGKLSVKLDAYARNGLQRLHLAPYAGAALRWVLDKGYMQKWLDGIVDYAATRTEGDDVKQAIVSMLRKEKDKFVNEGGSIARWFKQKLFDLAEASDAVNLEEAADTLHRDLRSFIEGMRMQDHELRIYLQHKMYELADTLESNADVSIAIDHWKRSLLKEISFQPSIAALMQSIVRMVTTDSGVKYIVHDSSQERLSHEAVKIWVTRLLSVYWNWFKQDEAAKSLLERHLQHFLSRIIESEHAVIGEIVRHTLDQFTEERLVQFIEGKVENDLQRIRLNGALIGALVGALLYTFLHGIYAPLLALL